MTLMVIDMKVGTILPDGSVVQRWWVTYEQSESLNVAKRQLSMMLKDKGFSPIGDFMHSRYGLGCKISVLCSRPMIDGLDGDGI